jgi:hypothetical protein
MPPLAWKLLLPTIVLFAGTASAVPPLASPRLRSLGSEPERLLREAMAGSETVRSLATRIEETDLIVYVRFLMEGPRRAGSTRLMASSGGTRFLLVSINPAAPWRDLIPRLGHELQHVMEIAAAPDVHDEAGFRLLFERIGFRSSPDSWETHEAIEAGRRVTDEVWASRSKPTALARR